MLARALHLLHVVGKVVGARQPIGGAAALAEHHALRGHAEALERGDLAPILLLGLAFVVVGEELFARLDVAARGKHEIPEARHRLLPPVGPEVVTEAAVVDVDAVDAPPLAAPHEFLLPPLAFDAWLPEMSVPYAYAVGSTTSPQYMSQHEAIKRNTRPSCQSDLASPRRPHWCCWRGSRE